ncbi:DUF3122 domain-containing protein [Aphanothece microscopica]|uniref:DUF3122 domain-containing protein n=1 Tax=Aphanothece microscopica TaxID=1049561 RepID=UPI003CE4487F
MPLLMALLVGLLLLPLPARAAADLEHWTLIDGSGHRWGLTLFEQPDPNHPAGWRLRLTALSPGQGADHQRPLLLRDGLGAGWSLPNRSEELVPAGTELIPTGSAQFDLGALTPRPHEALPLLLEVPTDGQGQTTPVMLPPAIVLALHGLPPVATADPPNPAGRAALTAASPA